MYGTYTKPSTDLGQRQESPKHVMALRDPELRMSPSLKGNPLDTARVR